MRRLAELADVSNPYLSQIERGLRKPSADILQQIAKALQISAESLYVRAGILDPDQDVVDERGRRRPPRPATSSPEQKQTLLRVYESFRAQAAAAGSAAEPARLHLTGRVGIPRSGQSVDLTVRRLAMLSHAHVAPGPAGRGRQRRDERLRARARRRRSPRPASTARPTCGAGDRRPARRGGRRAGLPRRAHRRRRSRPAQGAAARRRRAVRRPASSTTCARHGRRRPHPRQLLALGRGRAPHQARARPAARLHLPHPGPGEGRGRRRGAGVARAGRDGDHRLRRRHLRELHRGGAAVPPALRRPAGPDRDRGAGRRARLLRPRRPHGRPRRAGPRPGDPSRCCCSSGGSSRSRASTSPCAPSPRSTARTPSLVIVGGASGRTATPRSRRCVALVDELGLDRARPLRPAAAPPPAVQLLPRRRRRAGAEPVGELRPRRPGGRGLRHARRRRRRRWPAHAGRPRPHRLPGPRPRPRGLRQLHRRDPRQRAAGGGDGDGRAAQRSQRYTWSLAAARLRRVYADLTVGALVECT